MPLEHAILGFLQTGPMSGYNLKKHFDQSVGHFWSATQSHVYKALGRLQQRGLVEVEHIEQEGRPDRKDYSITPDGAEELHRWLMTPLPLDSVRASWLIQIFFAHGLSNDEIIHLLEARACAIREVLEQYRGEVQSQIDIEREKLGIDRVSSLWQMTLDYGIATYEADLAWIEIAIERARNLPPFKAPRDHGRGPRRSRSRG